MAAALNTCVACLRWTVFALNLFFWVRWGDFVFFDGLTRFYSNTAVFSAFQLAGLGILGVALWLRFDPAVGEYVMSLNKNMEQFYTSLYLLMAAGALMALFGFLGCFGALKLSPAMLTAVSSFWLSQWDARKLWIQSCCVIWICGVFGTSRLK